MQRFEQVKPNHVFQVGQTIRLGGRVGRITRIIGSDMESFAHTIDWLETPTDNGMVCDIFSLHNFPSLEIALPSPTISREAYEELGQWIREATFANGVDPTLLIKKIQSMLPDETRGEGE